MTQFPTRRLFMVFVLVIAFALIAIRMYYTHEEKMLDIEKSYETMWNVPQLEEKTQKKTRAF